MEKTIEELFIKEYNEQKEKNKKLKEQIRDLDKQAEYLSSLLDIVGKIIKETKPRMDNDWLMFTYGAFSDTESIEEIKGLLKYFGVII